MRQSYFALLVLLMLGGCTSVGPFSDQNPGSPRPSGPSYPRPEAPSVENLPGGNNPQPDVGRENLRLAQAQLSALNGQAVAGTVNFEQMPNSVIITYHLDGVIPSSEYQLAVADLPGCESTGGSAQGVLLNLRTNKTTSTDHTFKTEDFSVSAEQPLLGKWISLSPRNSKKKVGLPVACGEVVPFVPPAPPAETTPEEH